MRTGTPAGSGSGDLWRLGGVIGPPVEGNEVAEYVGEGVGGAYTMLVSLNVTCLPGIVSGKGNE
jgi:hypothetical protein